MKALVTTAAFSFLLACSQVADPVSTTAGEAQDPLGNLVAELQDSGAMVEELGSFNPDPLPGAGQMLCVNGQTVRIYLYETEEESRAVAARIDSNDPSNVGNAIVEWRGNPRFWHRGSLLVLYLGDDPSTEDLLTSIIGPLFATGMGRDPGPGAADC